jgi:hypothetical protein
VTPVVVELLSVPVPEPMLQVTPAFDESLVTVAVKACVPPPLSVALVGVTLTLMEGVVGFEVDPPPPPPPQPARNVKVDNPHKTTPRRKRADFSRFPNIGPSKRS